MQQKKEFLIALLFLSFWLTRLQAQEVIPTTGGNATGSGGSVSYSVGQVVYSSSSGTNGSVVQGVQQPYEISVISGIVDGEGINLTFSVYPNPTKDFLTLNLENFKADNLTYQLYDISGKLVETKQVLSFETSIAMTNLSPATYVLRVIKGNQVLKSFKIIKN